MSDVLPSERSDLELITEFKKGSAAGFEALYKRHAKRIFVFIYHMLGGHQARRETAADLTQEVFLRVHRKIDQYAEKGKFKSWIYQIARNHTLNYLESHRAGSEVSLEAEEGGRRLADFLRDETAAPDAASISAEDAEFVRKAIAKLSPQDREIIVLCEINGLPHAEVAEIMQCAVGTLDVRLHRAKERLAEIIEKRR